MEDIMNPETPREFALIERIKVLERALRQNGGIDLMTSPANAIIPLQPEHPELLRVANLTARRELGKWIVGVRGISAEPGKYYEISEYIDQPENSGWATSSVLASIHKNFIARLSSDLTKEYGDIWAKYHKEPT